MPSTLTLHSGALAATLRDVQKAACRDAVLPMLAGVMLHAAEHDGRRVLVATATDRYCALQGNVAAEGDLHRPVWLTRAQVRQVLTAVAPYTSRKRGTFAQVEIVVDDERATFRQAALPDLADVSIAIPLQSPKHGFPDITKVIETAREAGPFSGAVQFDGARLGIVASIAAAHHEYLRIRPTGAKAPALLQVADHLLGLLMPVGPGSDNEAALDLPVFPVPELAAAVAA